MTDPRQLEPSDFEGASLAQMRGWVEGGSADGLFQKKTGWEGEDKYLRDLADRVRGKLNEAGAYMQSKSGEAMQGAVAPIVLWTEVTADNAKAQSQLMSEQGEAFNKVKTSIPAKGEEQEVPDQGWLHEHWDKFWTGTTDAEDAKAHNEKLRQEAVAAFQAYDNSSQGAVAASAVFTPPPGGGVETSVQGGHVPSVGQQNPSFGHGGSATPSGTHSAGFSAGGGSGSGIGSGHGVGSGSGGGAGGGLGGIGSGGSGGAGTGSAWYERPGTLPVPGQSQVGPGQGGTAGGGTGGGFGGFAGGGGAGSGGAGGRAGGLGGRGGLGAGGRTGGPGAGGRAGAGGQAGSGSGSGSSAAGGRSGSTAAAGAGRGQGKRGEEDQEHETPEYLKGDHGFFDEDMPKVAPPVFGDWEQR
ncbi:hypothetical protein [Saccharopolyspora rosea]|uniref:hypothetical protein n=1 Tax=Saccharopolyspora rosea TaxID=524884 RepID=UPI0021DB5F23|nr:hypothetical protein [Saccharopolyspora rosea]